jgi:cell division protein FtsI (penicillin-binding protein 3)
LRHLAVRGFVEEHRQRQIQCRIFFTLAGLIIAFAVVALRLVELHILKGPEFAQQARKQHFRMINVKAERGAVLDRKARILAIDLKAPSVYAIPPMIKSERDVSKRLASVLKISSQSMTERLEGSRHFVWLGRKVDPATAEVIQRLDIEGIGFVMESRRFYPKRTLLGQLLGFTGVDHQGMEGIEYSYDAVLRGQEGGIRFERDAAGRAVYPEGFDYVAPSRGNDLILTVDEFLQHISERELDDVLTRAKAKAGTVIMMDPMTGEILALAIRPAFNPNTMPGSAQASKPISPDRWRNRAITDVYEPGSIFKIVTAAAALQEAVVKPADVIDCEEGSLVVAGSRIRDPFPHGLLTFREVVAQSSNVGMVKVAMRLGDGVFYRYARAFGFGEKSGLDLRGEVPGILRDPSQWSKRSLATLSIGQEIAVTPIQMVTAVSAIANGGLLMTPFLVKEVRNPEGVVVERFSPQVRRRVLAPEVAQQMKEILEGVTRPGGTGDKAAIPGYTVAGKTGTAQKIDPSTRRYYSDRFVSSFVGFVPAKDPRLAILVVVEEPEGVSWGGSVAAPVFKTIAQEALDYLGVLPQDKDRVLLADASKP